ncbi:MAG: glycosyltransferase family 87 protein [Candidatus Binatia bacterium]
MPCGRYAPHLLVLLSWLLLLQAPRLGGCAAQLAKPVFPLHRGYPDFYKAYYPAGRSILQDPSQLVSLYRGLYYDQKTGQFRAGLPHFVNIPVVAWLFVPFSQLPRRQAGALLLAVNLAITLVCLLLLLRRAAGSSPLLLWAITLAFMTSGPLMNALNYGQTTPLMLLLFLLGERFLQRGHDARAGVCLGLVCLIKIPPLLFLPYFALRRRWRLVSTAAAVLVVAGVASIVCYGLPLHATYFDLVVGANLGTAVVPPNNQSIVAVLARPLTDAQLLSWKPIDPGGTVHVLQGLVLAILLVLCGWVFTPPGRMENHPRLLLELGVVMCVSLLVSPISWVHYGIWLLPVAVVVGAVLFRAGRSSAARPRASALLVTAVLLINVPLLPRSVIRHFGDAMWFRGAMSYQAVGTLLLLGLCVWCLRRFGLERPVRRKPRGACGTLAS